jgi:hypothetical protein
MEKDPGSKEKLFAAFIYHPQVDFLAEGFGFLGSAGATGVRNRPLEALQPPPLGPVAL